jgi:hypothetical protein
MLKCNKVPSSTTAITDKRTSIFYYFIEEFKKDDGLKIVDEFSELKVKLKELSDKRYVHLGEI